MAQAVPVESVEAHIQGEVSGQIAVGHHIIQIGSIHGGVVNISTAQQPTLRPRPSPVLLRPRPFRGLLGREKEVKAVAAAFQLDYPVDVYGPAGIGKTSLLRYLTSQPPDVSFPDGIVYLSARRISLPDLLQSLFDAFYESNPPVKATDAQIRHSFQNKRALIVLDDIDLAPDEVETLLDVAPGCLFILAAIKRSLWSGGRPLALKGLSLEHATMLVERQLGRPFAPQERPAVQALHAALEGHPLHLIQAAALARDEGLALDEAARQVKPSPDVSQAFVERVTDTLSDSEKRVMAALVALGGAPLSAEHLTALTGLDDVVTLLKSLQSQSLLQAHSPRYSLTGPLNDIIGQMWNLEPWVERALLYFTDWAEAHRKDTERLLRDVAALLQVLEWAFNASRWGEVLRLGQSIEGALALGKRWEAWHEVLVWVLQAARARGDRMVEAWALHQIGSRALCLEDIPTARRYLVRALNLRESLGDRIGAAVTRHNLSILLSPPPAPGQPPTQPPSASPLLRGVLGFSIVLAVGLVAIGAWALGLKPTSAPAPTGTRALLGAPEVVARLTPSFTPSLLPLLAPSLGLSPVPEVSPSLQPMTPSDTPLANLGIALAAITSTPSATPSPTPSATSSPTPSATPSSTPSVTPSTTPSVTPSPTPSITSSPTPSPTPTPSSTPSPTPTNTPTITPSPTPDQVGPEAPRVVAPQSEARLDCVPDVREQSIRLEWTAVSDPSGIKSYEVSLEAVEVNRQVYPSQFFDGTVGDIALSCNESYHWRVRAIDNSGNVGDWSEGVYFDFYDSTLPPAPVALGPGSTDKNSPPMLDTCERVVLAWEPVSDPSGIQKYRVLLYPYDFDTGQMIWEDRMFIDDITDVNVNVTQWLSSPGRFGWFVWAVDNLGTEGNTSPEYYFLCPPPTG